MLIYGAGSRGTAVLREICEDPSLGYRAVGFVDDMPDLWGRRINDVPVLGSAAQLPVFLDQNDVHEVIIATPKIGSDKIEAVAAACRTRGVELRRFRISLEEVDTAPLVEVDVPAKKAAEG